MAELTQVEVQEVVDTAETLGRAAGRQLVIASVAAGVGGIVLGFTGGYLVARRRLWAKYAQMAESEIDDMREVLVQRQKDLLAQEQRPDPEELIERQGYRTASVTPPDIEPEVEVGSDAWSYEDEEERRGDYTQPYVIHLDEFTNERPETHEEMTVLYFEEDDILCDSRDIPIDDIDELVGLANLERFGHGSGDPNIVHVRNRARRLDLEILRHEGSFQEHVGASPPGEEDPQHRPRRSERDEQ